MRRFRVNQFLDILDSPAVWVELYKDEETGIWEISDKKYFVCANKTIIDIANGEKLDDNTINYKNVENRKTNKYAWVCYYLLENSLNNF